MASEYATEIAEKVWAKNYEPEFYSIVTEIAKAIDEAILEDRKTRNPEIEKLKEEIKRLNKELEHLIG